MRSRLTLATLNTRGRPAVGSRLGVRYRAAAEAFDASDVDLVCLQEVITYYHLRQIRRWMPSYRHAVYRPGPVGPAGGVVTFSRFPVAGSRYHRFPYPPPIPGVTGMMRAKAPLKGTLLTRLARPRLSVANTHPVANYDGDWSPANRYYLFHQGQLATLARLVRAERQPTVLCGDFNVAAESPLLADLRNEAGLTDAFAGRCPPTFRAEYLPPGRAAHCIDFILVAGSISVESTDRLFTGPTPMPGGPAYVSDHIGLQARLMVSG